jgi:hypothetical protein
MTLRTRAIAPFIAVGLLAAACESQPVPAPSPTQTGPTTLTISAVVRDEAGAPVGGAAVEATTVATAPVPGVIPTWVSASTISTDSGSYTLTFTLPAPRPPGSGGFIFLWATLEGYEIGRQQITRGQAPNDLRLVRIVRLVEGVPVDIEVTPEDNATVDEDFGLSVISNYRTLRFLPTRHGTLKVHVVPESQEAAVSVNAYDGVASACCAVPVSLGVAAGREVTIRLDIARPPVRAYSFTVTAVVDPS